MTVLALAVNHYQYIQPYCCKPQTTQVKRQAIQKIIEHKPPSFLVVQCVRRLRQSTSNRIIQTAWPNVYARVRKTTIPFKKL